MSLFPRKRDGDSQASILSEEEIQKKLYGEFKKDPARAAGAGERDAFPESSPALTPKAKSTAVSPDLFSVAKEMPKEPETESRPVMPSFSQSQDSLSQAEPVSTPSFPKPAEIKVRAPAAKPVQDPYERYRERSRSLVTQPAPQQGIAETAGKFGSFFREFFDSNPVLAKQILYWTGGVLAVFFLFWGVNALNVQREQAMKTKYHGEANPVAAVTVSAPDAKQAVPAAKTAEIVPEGAAIPAKAAVPVVPAPKSPALSKPASAAAVKRFVIQVATYPSKEYAERVVTSVKQAGFSGAFVKESVRSTGVTHFIVLIGGFKTAAEAQQLLVKFRANEVSRPFSDAFVKTTVE